MCCITWGRRGDIQLVCWKDLRHHPFLWFPYFVPALVYCCTARTRHVAHSIGMFGACLIKARGSLAVYMSFLSRKGNLRVRVSTEFNPTQKSEQSSKQRLNKNMNLRSVEKNNIKRNNRWYSRNRTKGKSVRLSYFKACPLNSP